MGCLGKQQLFNIMSIVSDVISILLLHKNNQAHKVLGHLLKVFPRSTGYDKT